MKPLVSALGRLISFLAVMCLPLTACKPAGDANGFGRNIRHFYATSRTATCQGPLGTLLPFYSGILELETDTKRVFYYADPCDPLTREEMDFDSIEFTMHGHYAAFKDQEIGSIFSYSETEPVILEPSEQAAFNLYLCEGVTADGLKNVGLAIRTPLEPEYNADGTVKINRADVFVGSVTNEEDYTYVDDVEVKHTFQDAGNGYDGGGLSAVVPYELNDQAGASIEGTFSFTNGSTVTTAPITCQWGTNDPPDKTP